MSAHIAASLQPLAEPLATLRKHPDNYRRGDVEGIRSSLRRFGQLRPILVQASTRYIVAGNHTFQAAQDENWSDIAAAVVDMSDEDALAYLVADNAHSDNASNDDESLLAALEKIQSTGQLEGIGYSADEVDDLIAAIEGARSTDVEQFTGGYAEDPDATAARWEGRDEGQNKEVVFLLPHEDYEQFRLDLEVLKAEHGTDSMARAIYLTVRERAQQLSTEPAHAEV